MSEKISIICPDCGEKIDIDAGHEICFCPACGRKIDINEVQEEKIAIGGEGAEQADTATYWSRINHYLKASNTGRKKRPIRISVIVLTAMMLIAIIVVIRSRPVTDHTGEVKVPASSSSFDSRNYEDVVMQLKSSGFTNISAVPEGDLITGWLTKENSVSSVSINGDDTFRKGTWYPADVKIVVRYHSFPNRTTSGSNQSSSSNNDENLPELKVDSAASIPEPPQGETDGFDEATNNKLDFHGITFSIPSYYEEQTTNDNEKDYAVAGEDGCSLGFYAVDISSANIDFDSLTSDQKNQITDNVVRNGLKSQTFSDMKIAAYQRISKSNMFGSSITLDADNYYMRLTYLICPSLDEMVVGLIATDDDSTHSYLCDYDKIIQSAAYTSNE